MIYISIFFDINFENYLILNPISIIQYVENIEYQIDRLEYMISCYLILNVHCNCETGLIKHIRQTIFQDVNLRLMFCALLFMSYTCASKYIKTLFNPLSYNPSKNH